MEQRTWVDEEHVLFNGSLIVFTTRTSKKPWFQVRISLPGVAGYQIRKSLKTTDRNEAIHLATELYLDARARFSQGITIEKYTWDMLVDEYLSTRTGDNYIRQFTALNKRYFKPFFGKLKTIENITDDMILKFWRFRIDFWKNNDKTARTTTFRQRATFVAEEPSYATIRKERSQLRSILRYAADKRHIPTFPIIEHPYRHDKTRDQGHRINKRRRASFTRADYDTLTTKMSGLCRRKKWWRDIQKRNWEALRLAVLLIANGLIRPQELKLLRYNQIELINEGDESWTVIHLHDFQAKTGVPRQIICEDGSSCYHYIQRYREWALYKDEHDLIFASDNDKTTPKTFDYTFNQLLKEWNLKYDSAGRPRTLYSLRHFGIEQMLIRNVPPVAIAKIAGTSLKMITDFYDETGTWMYRQHLNKNRTLYPFLIKERTNQAQGQVIPLKSE